jgi:hypothetical protein
MDLYLGQIKDVILGQDFLTWLWYKSETMNGIFTTAKGDEFALWLEQRVSVQGGEGDNVETATVSGPMAEMREVKLGLTTGKKVSKALVRIEHDTEVWQVTLKAEDFSLTSLKTPQVEAGKEDDDEPDARFLEKIYLVERCLSFIDEAYRQFLALRLNAAAWDDEAKAVGRWMLGPAG